MFKINLLLSAIPVIGGLILLYPHNNVRGASAESSALSAVIDSFDVQNSTMEEALRSLRQKDYARILIAFEEVAHREGEKKESLSLFMAGATVGEIVDRLCQLSRLYTYKTVQGAIIYIHPTRAQSDPLGLLDIRVRDFSLEGRMLPAAAVQRIGSLAPELTEHLDEARNKYYAGRGTPPSSPGAILGGNMDPAVSLHLHDVTVRQILNGLVLYSLQLHNQTQPDWTGNKIPPTSWIYEFVIDPSAPTGLGGTPRWIAF